MSERSALGAWVLVLAVVGVACGGGKAPAPTMTVSAGELVRGTPVTVGLDHLRATRGRAADVTIVTAHEVLAGGRKVVGYHVVGSTTVGSDGSATITFQVPNSLSGEDDVIPLDPGTEYVLEVVASNEAEGRDRIPFEVAAAKASTPYRVVVRRGPQECGAPPLEIDFDGRLWTPDDASAFPDDRPSFDGELRVQADGSGTFTASDGKRTTFTRAASGYSC